MFFRNAISKFKADFDEVEFFPSRSDKLSSQITSNNEPTSSNADFSASRDDLPNPFEPSEDEDDFELPKRNLFQSLQHNSSYVSLIASIKGGISSRPQTDSSKLNPTKMKPRESISSNNSTVPTTYSDHSESSQQNPSLEKALPPDPKRDNFAKSIMSAVLKPKVPKEPKDTHHDIADELVTRLKSPVEFSSDTSSFKLTNGNGVSQVPESSNSTSDSVDVIVYPKEHLSSTSVSHHSNDAPMIQPPVTQTSQSHGDSVTHNDDNLDAQLNTSETNNFPDSTPITLPTLTSNKLLERDTAVDREISIPGDFVSDKPSTSPNVQSPSLNSTTSSTSPNIQSPLLNSATSSTSPNIQSPLLNSTTPTSPNIQSPLLISTTSSTSPNIQSPLLNSTTSTSPNIQNLPLNPIASISPILSGGPFFTQSPSLNSTTTDSNPISPKENSPDRKAKRRKPDINSFLLNLVTPQVVSKEVPEKVQTPKTPAWGPPLRSLQRISESGDSLPSEAFTPAPDDILARKMEELGRLRRMESRNIFPQSTTSPETLSSRTTATSKAELRPQLQALQEDSSSDVGTMLREAYKERQQSLQTQLDKALAELRGVQAENKRLSSENQSQQRTISQLKIALETKREQDNSLTQTTNQLRVANSSLTLLNKEKKGWQDKLDSMQHKVSAAERQVRCLDYLTRHKLESRQEAGYGQPKRRGLFASIAASTDVIGAVRAMNEEIYQTCVQFADGLERTSVFSTSQKPQVQKVLGDHLTAMMEDQARKATSGYNMLLMQTVLEVFMIHWCSSIIEAFYPQQESFADLLVQLSAQTPNTSGYAAICGKQIKIIQSSTHYDNVKFNEWVKDIIKELGLFLTVAGLRIKTQFAALFTTKTLALVKVAYDLRTAMAEKDICGGLEIVIVPPDTAFQEKWMIDAYADPRKVNTDDQSRADYIAGTTGMGLQRRVSETVDGQFQSRMEIELKPKVTLVQALKSQQAKPIESARRVHAQGNHRDTTWTY